MFITKKSQVSGKINTMEINITPQEYEHYLYGRDRRLIQQMFPSLSASEREFLMTGTTPQEWDNMFKEDNGGKK